MLSQRLATCRSDGGRRGQCRVSHWLLNEPVNGMRTTDLVKKSTRLCASYNGRAHASKGEKKDEEKKPLSSWKNTVLLSFSRRRLRGVFSHLVFWRVCISSTDLPDSICICFTDKPVFVPPDNTRKNRYKISSTQAALGKYWHPCTNHKIC